MREDSARRVWIVSELFFPEETSTGHVMTTIAEHLSGSAEVLALCTQPGYSTRATKAPTREVWRGVSIRRCRSTHWRKDSLLGRVANALTISASIGLVAVAKFRSGDRVLVVTNPPLLPFVTLFAARVRGAKCFLLVHDVHPEQMIATGMISGNGVPARVLRRVSNALFRRVDHCITIGRDMAEVCRRKIGSERVPVTVITNWADSDAVQAGGRAGNPILSELGWDGKFVVQYAGNMGRPNAIEAVAEAARELQADERIRFLFVGSGAKREWLARFIAENGLRNAQLRAPLPRTMQSTLLGACDITVVPLVPGMLGLGVPSRTYNALAAGKPVVALAHERSELARLVAENEVGWVVPENRPGDLAATIVQACDRAELRREMSVRARTLASGVLSRASMMAKFESVLLGDAHSVPGE